MITCGFDLRVETEIVMSDGKLSDEDMADLGRALLLAIRTHVSPVWHPMDCPSEIVGDLCNTIVELKEEVLALQTDADRYRKLRDQDNWGEDTADGGGSRWELLGELDGLEFDCMVDALTPWLEICDEPVAVARMLQCNDGGGKFADLHAHTIPAILLDRSPNVTTFALPAMPVSTRERLIMEMTNQHRNTNSRMPVPYEEYVKALEKCLADHVISREEMHPVDATYSSLLNMEVNGLAMALRMTGLYGTTAFDLAWATSPDRPEVPWQDILHAGYLPY